MVVVTSTVWVPVVGFVVVEARVVGVAVVIVFVIVEVEYPVEILVVVVVVVLFKEVIIVEVVENGPSSVVSSALTIIGK